MRLIIGLAAVLAMTASSAGAQDFRLYAGGAYSAFTQTHGESQPLGGTKSTGSALFGVWVSKRLAVEVEPTFGVTFSQHYSYNVPLGVAEVHASRQDTFLLFQVRTRVSRLEPVVGLGYAHGAILRDATFANGSPYFHEESVTHDLVIAVGADVAAPVGTHVDVVPTFRLLFTGRTVPVTFLPSDTSTGSLAVRYGVGARIRF